jgi:glycerol-3-phosphate dehydrogenase (NAD(P)+)
MSLKKHKDIENISVIGDGGWGTTIAILLAKKGYNVTLWGAFDQYTKAMQKNRYNPKFLPGIKFPRNLEVTSKMKSAINDKDLVVFAVPSKFARRVLKKMKRYDFKDKYFLNVTKGFDNTKLLLMNDVIKQELGKINFSVLSGPTIAVEVARGIPSTAVIASDKIKQAKELQHVLNTDTFRVYSNNDVIGVELGGSIKNIIAIACGVCDGLGFGSNTKAAILTRGLAEMTRLGKALGAKPKTFNGLSGLGDLVTTCVSPQSRNRSVGEKLGKGLSIKQILSKMDMVAEGVETVKGAHTLSQKLKVPMPITEEIYNIIYKHKKPSKAVEDLMTRRVKAE